MAIICLQCICDSVVCNAHCIMEWVRPRFVLSNQYGDLNRRTMPFQERARVPVHDVCRQCVAGANLYTWLERNKIKQTVFDLMIPSIEWQHLSSNCLNLAHFFPPFLQNHHRSIKTILSITERRVIFRGIAKGNLKVARQSVRWYSSPQ